MGDTGSLFLGYCLAVIPFLFMESHKSVGLLNITPFIIMYAYLIVDTLRVMLMRYRQNKNPLSPGNEHLHHLLIEETGSYNGTLFLIFFFVALACLTALNETLYSSVFSRISILIIWALMIFSESYKQYSIKHSKRLVSWIRRFMTHSRFKMNGEKTVLDLQSYFSEFV